MANTLMPAFKQSILNEAQDLDTDGVRAILINLAQYTFNSAHDFLDDVAVGARAAVSADLASPTIAAGVFDTSDFVWSAVPAGPACGGIYLYNNGMGGSDATRGLIVWYDTGVTGLPITPNGSDINVAVNAAGWFAL